MALDSALKYAVKRIYRTLRDYATGKGMKQGEYRILFEVNEDWGSINVIFAINPDRFAASSDWWFEIKRFVASHLGDEPELASSFTLRVEEDKPDNNFLRLVDNRFSTPEELFVN